MSFPSLPAALVLGLLASGPSLQDSEEGQDRQSGPILEGTVINDVGEPVAGVRVTLFGGLATRWKVGEATTDEQGDYRFDPLTVGARIQDESAGRWDYTVGMQIDHPEYVSADGQWWWDVRVPDVDGQVTRQDFRMTLGGALLGILLDEYGKPYALSLRLQGVGHDYFRWIETGADGSLDERGLFPGDYKIDVNDGNLDYPVIGNVRIAAGEVTTVRLNFSRETEQAAPPLRPKTFGENVLSHPGVSRGSFAPDGKTFYFSRRTGAGPRAYSLHVSERKSGQWQRPTRLDLGAGHGGYGSSPAVSADGSRLVFASHRAPEGAAGETAECAGLWMSLRQGDSWGPPRPLTQVAPPSDELASPVFGPEGRLHFLSTSASGEVRSLLSEWNGETYGPALVYEPIQRWLGRDGHRAVWSGMPAPDGSFVLLTVSEWSPTEGMPRPADLWVSFAEEGGWTEPRPLKGAVNSGGTDCFPSFFPDGRQLLFVRDFLTYERVSLERALDR